MGYIVGIDTGGTFTDVSAVSDTGDVFMDKSATTPDNLAQGVMDAFRQLARTMDMPLADLLQQTATVKHGTTVGTNALITRRGSRVGLITTRGFEDTTLIMRAIGRVAGLPEEGIKHQTVATKPEPIVPRERTYGVTERVDFEGNVLIPLNLAEARRAIRELVEVHRVDAIAINLLFGFVNPRHERVVRDLVAAMYPDREIITSTASDICPVIREYARSNTVILNAYLAQTMQRYIGGLDQELRRAGFAGQLLLMQANGGAVQRDEMIPIGTLHSGPASGMIASKFMADLLGHENVITTDMGGTSFDVGLLVDGNWHYTGEPVVERFHITWPMIRLESIGAGGGTIAWIDPDTGRLRMGPQSAGARPGPVCYGRGGTEPTVTDADLVLGILDPDYFLGGRMRLDYAAAQQAITAKVARPLGMDVIQAAAAMYQIVGGHMADLIRKEVIPTGKVPEQFDIYSFGGAGPVHATSYAHDLGARRIYVFPTSAVFSAFGAAAADLIATRAFSRRYLFPVPAAELNDRLGEIDDHLLAVMVRQGATGDQVQFRRTFHMRYRRQLNELPVPVPNGRYTDADVETISQLFEQRYEQVYGAGSAYREAGMELISVTVDAVARTAKPRLRPLPLGPADATAARKGRRQVYLPEACGWVDCLVYDCDHLRPGNACTGPAICETRNTTVVIPPGYTAHLDGYLNLELSRT